MSYVKKTTGGGGQIDPPSAGIGLSDQLISIKLAFLSMNIVENYKENMLRSASDSTYIFLLKIKNFCLVSVSPPPSIPQ